MMSKNKCGAWAQQNLRRKVMAMTQTSLQDGHAQDRSNASNCGLSATGPCCAILVQLKPVVRAGGGESWEGRVRYPWEVRNALVIRIDDQDVARGGIFVDVCR